jgi:hypothetical protein
MEMIFFKLRALIKEETMQYVVFIALSVIVLIMTSAIIPSSSSSFQKYFGRIHPVLAVFISSALGLILLALILPDGQFAIYRSGNYRGILAAVGLSVLFAAATILVDRKVPFPADINVPFPDSLFFYPAMAYVVELLFHLVPFCLLYFILRHYFGEANSDRIIWICILAVALIEPVFQIAFGAGQNPPFVSAYMALHLFLFNMVQLVLFREFDFVSMYTFRLSYYFLWHILWGHLRLGLLF